MAREARTRSAESVPASAGAAVASNLGSTAKPMLGRRPWWPTATAVVVIAACAGVYGGYRQYRVSRLAHSVRECFAERRFAAAREPLSRWLLARPSSGEAHYYRGWLALVDDNPPEAIAAIEQSRRLGYDPEPLDCLAAIYQARASRYALAEPALAAAYRNGDPPRAEVAKELARIYLSTYRLAEAAKVLETWRALVPDDPQPYLWANEIASRSDVDPSVLIRNYRAALDRDPKLAKAQLGLAQQLSKARRFDEADQAYQAYLKLNPKDAAAHVGMGRNAFQQGRIDEAASQFEKALALDPRDAVALRELSQIELRLGRFQQARERLDRLVQIEPFDPDAHYSLARVLHSLGDEKRAREEGERSVQLRREEKEIVKWRETLLKNPTDLNARFEVAKWMLLHGHGEEGLRWTTEILRANPRHAPTHQLLADYYQKLGNTGLANYHRLLAARGD
jgi:tetratricopeptide (TPR) repeat protein